MSSTWTLAFPVQTNKVCRRKTKCRSQLDRMFCSACGHRPLIVGCRRLGRSWSRRRGRADLYQPRRCVAENGKTPKQALPDDEPANNATRLKHFLRETLMSNLCRMFCRYRPRAKIDTSYTSIPCTLSRNGPQGFGCPCSNTPPCKNSIQVH